MKKPKITNKERDKLIYQQYLSGDNYQEVGKKYGISGSRVGHIIKQANLKKQQAEESGQLLFGIRCFNDLNRPWNREQLLNAIEYPPRVRHLIDTHFCPDEKEITLRMLMDWCLPEVTDNSSDFYNWLPLYRIKGFAQYCVGDMIHSIDKVDFGTKFNAEWTKRRNAFRAKFHGGVESGKRSLL